MTTIILDPHWRSMDELFSASAKAKLARYDIVWGQNGPIPENVLQDALPRAGVLIAATPQVTRETLDAAPNLKAVIEVSGSFPDTIDYAACAERDVEVLCCAPGFRSAVAEMGLAMTLSATRGLVREHEAFRVGEEKWLEDCARTDFTLFGASLGFVGFGQIAQEMMRLLAPFRASVSVFDPWLPSSVAQEFGVTLTDLETLAETSDVLYVTAVPTADNKGMIGSDILSRMRDHSLLILLSRAHLVDFEAVVAEAETGRLTVATDVFPSEPLKPDHPIRRAPGAILSPHRAAAVKGGRHLIGDLLLQDIAAIDRGAPERQLLRASADRIKSLAGVGDATAVEAMAVDRS